MMKTNIPVIRPSALQPGDTVAIVAPAGPIMARDLFENGVATLERLGFRVRFDDRIFQSVRYLAGSDADRAEELMRVIQDPSVQAIVALRGGYGCARLIPLLDEKRLRTHPKIFMGFSDLTTLHLLFNSWGWCTFHGPMAATATMAEMSAEQSQHLLSLWTDPDYLPALHFAELETWVPGVAEGILTGGCLSLVVASLGTAYEIETKGKILFLEDVGEPVYRIDRMLTHLHLAGKLEAAAGILLGRFIDCEPEERLGYAVTDVLQDVLSGFDIPILANFPAGHVRDNWTLPLGVRVRLDANAHRLQFLESATR